MAWKLIESQKEYDKKYYLKHKAKIYLQHSLRRAKNKERIAFVMKKYYLQNKERLREKQRAYYLKQRELILAHKKVSRVSLGIRTTSIYWNKNLLRLKKNISRQIGLSLNKKGLAKNGSSWEKIVGYSLDTLKNHLEKQFTSKMNWGNYGSYWHIDHKIPVSFSSNSTEVIELFQLENLQPLEAKENLRKNNKIIANLFNLNMGALI